MTKTMGRTLIIFITIITMFFQTTTVNADMFNGLRRIDDAGPTSLECRFIQYYANMEPRVFIIHEDFWITIDHCYANYIGYDMKLLDTDIATQFKSFFELGLDWGDTAFDVASDSMY